MFLLVFKGSSR